MTAKEWLMRAWKIDREVNALFEAQKAAYDRLTSATAACGNVPVSSTKDPHIYDSYVELANKLNDRIDELCAVKAEITELIGRLDDPRLRTLLTARYISCLTFEQIASEMHYSGRWVLRLHRKALEKIDEIINRPC